MEKQFRKIYEEATRKTGVTGLILIEYLERRLENVVYRRLLKLEDKLDN